MKKCSFNIELNEEGKRIDAYLSGLFSDLSRSRIQQLIKEEKAIFVNNELTKSSYKIRVGDEIEVNIPDAKPLELEAQNIPLDVRFEDENMLVINKPSGMLTHPTSIERENTLVNALLHHCKDNLSGINGIMRPGIVHRLDRDTSGLLLIAKNDFAHKFLSEQIKEKTAIRQYLAVVCGNIKQDSGLINKPIDRHLTQRHKMGIVEGGRHAVTHWKVMERFKDHTLVELTLETGRTHQIRVHMSDFKHPVVGDPLYGGANINLNLHGQALIAYRLTFTNPTNNERMTIQIDVDDDMKKLLKYLHTLDKTTKKI